MSISKHILVVDDEESVRMTLAANLELGGYEVTVAEDGQRAVELVATTKFDLVITDVRMPRRGGLETFREIKRLRPGLAVIMMTAFTAESILDQAFAEGIYTVLYKPFSMEGMLDLIPRAIAGGAVLVVDDSVDQAEMIVRMLEDMGVRAEAVFDGASAVRRVKQNDVDVCVLDLVMPGMDGIAICEEIRKFDKSIAVVGISAYSMPEMLHKLASQGGTTCLRKPFEGRELAKVIAQARAASVRV